MNLPEFQIYQKTIGDFKDEIVLLDAGLSLLLKSTKLLALKEPLLAKPIVSILKNCELKRKCAIVHTLLISHSVSFLRASRLLLVSGYISPSLSCLRTAFESFQKAYICLKSEKQAANFFENEEVDYGRETNYPVQLSSDFAKEFKSSLSNHGVHISLKAFQTQAEYFGSIFVPQNKKNYEFIFLRNIYSLFILILLLLDYMLDYDSDIKENFPDVLNVIKAILKKIEVIQHHLSDSDKQKK